MPDHSSFACQTVQKNSFGDAADSKLVKGGEGWVTMFVETLEFNSEETSKVLQKVMLAQCEGGTTVKYNLLANLRLLSIKSNQIGSWLPPALVSTVFDLFCYSPFCYS